MPLVEKRQYATPFDTWHRNPPVIRNATTESGTEVEPQHTDADCHMSSRLELQTAPPKHPAPPRDHLGVDKVRTLTTQLWLDGIAPIGCLFDT